MPLLQNLSLQQANQHPADALSDLIDGLPDSRQWWMGVLSQGHIVKPGHRHVASHGQPQSLGSADDAQSH